MFKIELGTQPERLLKRPRVGRQRREMHVLEALMECLFYETPIHAYLLGLVVIMAYIPPTVVTTPATIETA